jgi:hypothetical protein
MGLVVGLNASEFRVVEMTLSAKSPSGMITKMSDKYSYDDMGRIIRVDTVTKMKTKKEAKTYKRYEEIIEFTKDNRAVKIKYVDLDENSMYYSNIIYDNHSYIKEKKSDKGINVKYTNIYDGDKLTKQTDRNFAKTYIYNSKNQIIKIVSKDTTHYEYNDKNQLVKSYNKDNIKKTFSYSYNSDGALIDVKTNNITFHYIYENKPCTISTIKYNPLSEYIDRMMCKK